MSYILFNLFFLRLSRLSLLLQSLLYGNFPVKSVQPPQKHFIVHRNTHLIQRHYHRLFLLHVPYYPDLCPVHSHPVHRCKCHAVCGDLHPHIKKLIVISSWKFEIFRRFPVTQYYFMRFPILAYVVDSSCISHVLTICPFPNHSLDQKDILRLAELFRMWVDIGPKGVNSDIFSVADDLTGVQKHFYHVVDSIAVRSDLRRPHRIPLLPILQYPLEIRTHKVLANLRHRRQHDLRLGHLVPPEIINLNSVRFIELAFDFFSRLNYTLCLEIVIEFANQFQIGFVVFGCLFCKLFYQCLNIQIITVFATPVGPKIQYHQPLRDIVLVVAVDLFAHLKFGVGLPVIKDVANLLLLGLFFFMPLNRFFRCNFRHFNDRFRRHERFRECGFLRFYLFSSCH